MRVTEVAADVFAVEGEAVGWTILREGGRLTLVDAGYPGDLDDVLRSLRHVGGGPEALDAVLVTHSHVDHIGTLPALVEAYDVPVLAAPAEVPLVQRQRSEQAGPLDVLLHLWRPGMLAWSLGIVRRGALRDHGVASARALDPDQTASLPGSPVPIACPGHTSGHTAYLVPGAGALLTGDALVTAHPVSRRTGPQLLPGMFHHDPVGADRALDALAEVDAQVVVPGHGPAYRGTPADAVALARA